MSPCGPAPIPGSPGLQVFCPQEQARAQSPIPSYSGLQRVTEKSPWGRVQVGPGHSSDEDTGGL